MMRNIEEEECEQSDYYDFVLTPFTAPENEKNGVTFRGSDNEYFKSHNLLRELIKTKGDRFLINGVDISIADAPYNKPATISIKTKNGTTGKANIKIYSKNKRGSATIMVTKVKGGSTEDVSNLAFKVVKFLLDNMISGEIEWEDIMKMKKPSEKVGKRKKQKKCEECQLVYQDQEKFDEHVNIHKVNDSVLSGNTLTEKRELSKPLQKQHSELRSPNAKRMKEEKQVESTEKEERMEVDDELVVLSNLKDEKVIKRQLRFEEEEKRDIENKKKKEREQLEEEKKKKGKRDSQKKRKNKKRKSNENANDSEDLKPNLKEVDKKFTSVMREAGLNIDEYCVFSAAPDGACGSTCTAIHCHMDKKLGRYVRRNINGYLIEFWPFFKSYFTFPLDVTVGLTNKIFENESTFLDFLKNDSQSGLMWMDHFGLQIVSNMYQISVHILTTGLVGLEEPGARWTHIEPDKRLSSFSKVHKGLPDMWLLHVNETHFDLLVRKDSELAAVGCIDDMEDKEDDDKEEQKTQEETHGPGYMGWKIKEDKEIIEETTDYKKELADIKTTLNMMKEEYAEMKLDFQKEEKKEILKLKNEIKGIKEAFIRCMDDLKEETFKRNEAETLVKVLKDTIEARKIMDEKQEIMGRKCDKYGQQSDKVEKHRVNNKAKAGDEENLPMEIDETVEEVNGVWEMQRKQKLSIRKRNRSLNDKNSFNCQKCTRKFQTEDERDKHQTDHKDAEFTTCDKTSNKDESIEEHKETHSKNLFPCDICDNIFHKKEDLWKHGREHEGQELECEECTAKFLSSSDLNTHVSGHRMEKKFNCKDCGTKFADEISLEMHKQKHNEGAKTIEFECAKCDKKYGSMHKLRRHDWRSHRCIECTICGEQLESRQEISNHRQIQHKIFKINPCKYYPDCYDGDECFFEHNDKDTGCPNGVDCKNQACEFSEKDHKSMKNRKLCKFQEKCYRSGCSYAHIKQPFLGGRASYSRIN